jgi:hypothetical protein
MTVINTYHIGVYTRQTSKDVGFLAVLTEDASGQLAVYIGISGNLDPDSDGYSGHRGINRLINRPCTTSLVFANPNTAPSLHQLKYKERKQ